MSQIMYQFPINDALYRDFLAVAKQLNRTDVQLMRELMADFVRQQTAPQTQSIAQVLGGRHDAADVEFEFERDNSPFRIAEWK